ncbi:10025_t:CDS:2 [Ambispora gerdemannii]|uniref:10025_t:CDS:1 n=1 Tax=Ambispora gerdemannii TaxID=144530 RepID=A0A9N9CB27_9GLOM|nr:10025_t:CDS:2 [Ambispora gerdemannii]
MALSRSSSPASPLGPDLNKSNSETKSSIPAISVPSERLFWMLHIFTMFPPLEQ